MAISLYLQNPAYCFCPVIKKMNIKNYLWILPFLFFIGGYTLSRLFFHTDAIEAPSLIGKSLHEACTITSDLNLNTKIIEHKDNPDLPEGTVLLQIPAAGQSVKQ